MIWRVRLTKDVGEHKAGDYINATPAELKAAGLVNGEDYKIRGTHPQPVKSDPLPIAEAPQADEAIADTPDADENKPAAKTK